MKPRILGITGGIGSGKSYLSQLLTQQYGIPVYDCDREAKRLNNESEVIRQGLVTLLGTTLYDQQGHLRKDLLATYLFQSPQHQQQVNSIIHPVVRQDFLDWVAQHNCPIVGIESAILLESGFCDMADEIITVTAPVELRIQRAMQRDASTRQQVEQRIRLQLSDEQRIAQSHHVIQNDGRDLTPQIEHLITSTEHTKN